MIEHHSIQFVARRTGLSPHVIRAWERRYKAVRPCRSATNRRLYSAADIERLKLLRLATRAGYKISEIAPLSNADLEILLRDSVTESVVLPSSVPEESTAAKEFFDPAARAVEALDAEELDAVFSRASARLRRHSFLEHLVLPLMHWVGEGWRDGRLRMAHEHHASATVRSFLGALERSHPAEPDAPRLVVATPSGQIHELGALSVAAEAAAEGWRVTYLGASLPSEEILAARALSGACAVALSITYPPDDPFVDSEIRRLGAGLGAGVSLFVGGRSAEAYALALEESGGLLVPDLGGLKQHLEWARRESGGCAN